MNAPLCPLCHRQTRPHRDHLDDLLEWYVCPTTITYADVYRDCLPIPHYEWNNPDQHTWCVGPYKLELDESGLAIYKFNAKAYKTDYKAKPSWEYIMFLEQQIPIDDSNKILNKIKTIITFS